MITAIAKLGAQDDALIKVPKVLCCRSEKSWIQVAENVLVIVNERSLKTNRYD